MSATPKHSDSSDPNLTESIPPGQKHPMHMRVTHRWRKDQGPRIAAATNQDESKHKAAKNSEPSRGGLLWKLYKNIYISQHFTSFGLI